MIAVFTDLDGTLLDHDTYRFDAALPAIAALKERSIPLILASSKTEAEMRPMAASLGIDTPMIVENGAGIADPREDAGQGDSVYRKIRYLLTNLPQARHFTGFGDWTAEEVARETGLSVENASRAHMRCFSEPGRWSGSPEEKSLFIAALAEHGLNAVQGGRFLTIMPRGSKADAMRHVATGLAKPNGSSVFTIALGDAPNDLAMIEAADLGIIIANPHHAPLPVTGRERSGHVLRSSLAGPDGWNESILGFLARCGQVQS